MPTQQVHHLHPSGWESDPAEEYFPLSTLDYLVAQMWCNYALFFKLPSSTPDAQSRLVDVLRRGLERTLSQCRQLSGVLAADPSGSGLCFHKTRESTVEFHVQWLDGPEHSGIYPSFASLERAHFVAAAMGAPETWCVAPFLGGERPEARHPNRPKAAAYKATFIDGGMVFMMHHHHYSGDIMAWSGQLRQLAENCSAVWSSSSLSEPAWPAWDPACLDLSRVTRPDLPAEQQVDGPTPPSRHPAHRPSQRVLFHLSRSGMAELKRRAAPPNNDDGTGRWVSSYDAYMAQLWRVLSKHKARIYSPDAGEKLVWGEAVNMRGRFRDPPVPRRIQGNVLFAAISAQNPAPQPTASEVISDAPFWELAWYIRQLTNSVTPESLDVALAGIAPIRNKASLFFRTDAFHPMSNLSTDWRDARPYEADFGFARPYAFRWPFETVMDNMWVVHPTRVNGAPAGEDEGNEVSIPVEKELLHGLLADPEWNGFFEFRGVEVDDGQEMAAQDKEVVGAKLNTVVDGSSDISVMVPAVAV